MNDLKIKNHALMMSLQADAKDFDGGITGLAEIMGCNASTLANQLNPDKKGQSLNGETND